MTFWAYLKYSIYDWLSFFGCEPNSWKHTQKIHETREEAT